MHFSFDSYVIDPSLPIHTSLTLLLKAFPYILADTRYPPTISIFKIKKKHLVI